MKLRLFGGNHDSGAIHHYRLWNTALPPRRLLWPAREDIVTPEQRAQLKRCYPEAVVHTFHGAGHTPWMSHREEYLSVIKNFLDQH